MSLNWSEEEKNLDHLIDALHTLETDCPSQEVILSDNWSVQNYVENFFLLIILLVHFISDS